MSEFTVYFTVGLKHVLNTQAYDHVLFLMALSAGYAFKDWKRLLLLVSVFTLGHTLALFLSVFGWLSIDSTLVEFCIPLTILFTAVANFFSFKKSNGKQTMMVGFVVTVLFGLIHGLGFSNYFKALLPGTASDKIFPLLEFALGIEGAQATVVLTMLILSYIARTFFKCSNRDFIMVISAFIVGVTLPMILSSEFLKNL